jgi:hypothetical protein
MYDCCTGKITVVPEKYRKNHPSLQILEKFKPRQSLLFFFQDQRPVQ